LLVAACSPASNPATTPYPPPSTTSTTRATTTTLATTTTVDRLTEIEAILLDLEERRLDALFTGDREAFTALFANETYLQESMEAFDVLEFIAEPKLVVLQVVEVLFDDSQCIAARVFVDDSQSLGPEAVGEYIDVLQRTDEGNWGYSFGGEGWLCDGPHPFGA
jgi:hypothetical protein